LGRAAVGLVVVLFVVRLVTGIFAAFELTKAKRAFDPTYNPAVYGMVYEDVSFRARDYDAEIAAW
jgi:hypothetical protein